MSWILCNTRADRLAVDFMSAASIADIEDAEGILEDIMIMFFPGREAETIDEMDAAQIGRSIRAAAHMLSHALTRYRGREGDSRGTHSEERHELRQGSRHRGSP